MQLLRVIGCRFFQFLIHLGSLQGTAPAGAGAPDGSGSYGTFSSAGAGVGRGLDASGNDALCHAPPAALLGGMSSMPPPPGTRDICGMGPPTRPTYHVPAERGRTPFSPLEAFPQPLFSPARTSYDSGQENLQPAAQLAWGWRSVDRRCRGRAPVRHPRRHLRRRRTTRYRLARWCLPAPRLVNRCCRGRAPVRLPRRHLRRRRTTRYRLARRRPPAPRSARRLGAGVRSDSGAPAHEAPPASDAAAGRTAAAARSWTAAGGGTAAACPSAAARAAFVETFGLPALPITSSPKARYISKRLLPLRGFSLAVSA